MENPIVKKANAQRSGTDMIVSPQESHLLRSGIGEKASTKGSSYKPKEG